MNSSVKSYSTRIFLASLLTVGLTSFFPAIQAVAASDQADADLRLSLDKVELDASTGRLNEGRALLEQLKQKYPSAPEIQALESELQLQNDNRGIAFKEASKLGTSGSLDRENHQRAALLSPNGQFVSGGYNFRRTKETYENIETIKGQMAIAPDLALSTTLINDTINTRVPFLHTNGTLQGFSGDRQIGAISADKFFSDGQEVVGSLYAVQNSAGLGGQYRFWDTSGASSISVDFNKPDMDYVESAVEHGTKTNVILERKQIFSEEVQARIDGKYTQYSLDGSSNAASAPGWDFDLDYTYPYIFSSDASSTGSFLADPFVFGARYGVGAEYFSHIQSSYSSTHTAFSPLPVSSYEVHSFTASATKNIFAGFQAEVSGGIAVNRIAGNSGPIYGLLLNYVIDKEIGVNFHANRDLLGGQNNSEKEDNIGMDLKWMW